MADNITLNSGTGGDTVAADEIAGVKHQRVKVSLGADGSATDAVGGAGAVSSAVQRVTLASDDPAVASLQALDNPIYVDDAAYTPAVSSVMMVGFTFDDSSPDSVNEGDAGAARMSSRREVYVQLRDAAGNERGLNVDTNGALAIGSIIPTTTATSIAKAVDSAAGATDTGIAVLAVRDDSTTTLTPADGDFTHLRTDDQGNLRVNVTGAITGLADDAAFSVASQTLVPVAFLADETSTDSVNEGDGGAARITLDRKLITSPQPHTGGGLSTFRSLDLDETEEDVKTSVGQVYGAWVTNTATSTRWLKFYNLTAANTTVGSSTPKITIGIPGNTSDDISAHFTGGGYGIEFDTAICVAATTGVADNDTGAPAANDVIVNIFYK